MTCPTPVCPQLGVKSRKIVPVQGGQNRWLFEGLAPLRIVLPPIPKKNKNAATGTLLSIGLLGLVINLLVTYILLSLIHCGYHVQVHAEALNPGSEYPFPTFFFIFGPLLKNETDPTTYLDLYTCMLFCIENRTRLRNVYRLQTTSSFNTAKNCSVKS